MRDDVVTARPASRPRRCRASQPERRRPPPPHRGGDRRGRPVGVTADGDGAANGGHAGVSVAATYAEALFEAAADGGRRRRRRRRTSPRSPRRCESRPELRAVLDEPRGREARQEGRRRRPRPQGAHPLTANFLQVLIDRGRIAELPGDRPRLRGARGARRAGAPRGGGDHRRAAARRPARADRASASRARPAPTVDLTESVDPDIVGGLVLRVGGVVGGRLRPPPPRRAAPQPARRTRRRRRGLVVRPPSYRTPT